MQAKGRRRGAGERQRANESVWVCERESRHLFVGLQSGEAELDGAQAVTAHTIPLVGAGGDLGANERGTFPTRQYAGPFVAAHQQVQRLQAASVKDSILRTLQHLAILQPSHAAFLHPQAAYIKPTYLVSSWDA